MVHHLVKGEPGNSRNGYGRKTVTTGSGKIELEIPRDRAGSFDPALIAKYQRRFPGFDEKIISMYARGMSVRELYGIDVSPDLISTVTDAVLEALAAWQARPLEAVYPLIFFDALRVKIRDEGTVRNKAVHIALGVRVDGTKEVLGLWLEQNEGAKFWLMLDLRAATPRKSRWRTATFETIHTTCPEIAARIEALRTRIRVSFPSATPNRPVIAHMLSAIEARAS